MGIAEDVFSMMGGGAPTPTPQPSSALSAASALQPFDVKSSYGTPPALLDNLRSTESSNDPLVVQKDTKALGAYQFLPETVAALHKQGIKFNPFDEQESRAAADYYLQTLLKQNDGDWSKTLAQYGGFKTKNPSDYVNKVMKGVNFQTEPDNALHIEFETSSPKQFNLQGDVLGVLGLDQKGNAVQSTFPTNIAKYGEPGMSPSQYGGEVPEFTAEEAEKGFAPFAAAGDIAAGIIPAAAETAAYWLSRLSGKSPQEAHEVAKRGEPIENPIGKLTGLINDPAYQNSLPMQAANLVSRVVSYPGQKLSEATGLDPLDAQYGTNLAMFAVPEAARAIRAPSAAGLAGEAQAAGIMEAAKGRAGEARAAAQAEKIRENVKNGFPIDHVEPTPPPAPEIPQGSVGAAGVTPETMAATGSADLQEAVRRAGPNVNKEVLGRHLDAESLPVPVKLLKGQATRDPVTFSDEWNFRKQDSAVRADQNQALAQNFDKIEDRELPNVFSKNAYEDGENLIRAYQAYDEPIKAKIDGLYQKLRDANGGEFPIDSSQFAGNVRAALQKDMSEGFLPAPFEKILQKYEGENAASMSFADFETLRTKLATEMRSASRKGEGNVEHALGVMRDQLEQIPMPEGTAGDLKAMADEARAAARNRFQELRDDPAYKAALNDVDPKNFVQRYVINADARDVAAMRDKFGRIEDMPNAPQFLTAAGLRYLKEQAVKERGGEVSWAENGKFNTALQKLRQGDKLDSLFNVATKEDLDKLNRVSTYIYAPPPGGFINSSGTAGVFADFLQSAGAKTAGGLEYLGNLASAKTPIQAGTIARQAIKKVREGSAAKKRVEPYQGLDYQGPQSGENTLTGVGQ